jgi:hypothetical protein
MVQLHLLHLDDALELQPDFVHSAIMAGAHEADLKTVGRSVRLWGGEKDIDTLWHSLLRTRRPPQNGARLCFMGSGDFHHVSALLLTMALEDTIRPVTVVHIDNHPDWVRFSNGIHCGSWVNKALDNRQVEKVITLGVCSNDLCSPERKGANLAQLSSGRLELYPYDHSPSKVRQQYEKGASYDQTNGALHWQMIASIGEANFIERLLSRISTEDVYLTIDKDALATDDAVTNWDQGHMRLPYVLSLISEIGARHRIIGADVTGDYSTPNYSGGLWTRTIKKAEILIDQPLRKPDSLVVRNINSAANHALLDVLGEQMQ